MHLYRYANTAFVARPSLNDIIQLLWLKVGLGFEPLKRTSYLLSALYKVGLVHNPKRPATQHVPSDYFTVATLGASVIRLPAKVQTTHDKFTRNADKAT